MLAYLENLLVKVIERIATSRFDMILDQLAGQHSTTRSNHKIDLERLISFNAQKVINDFRLLEDILVDERHISIKTSVAHCILDIHIGFSRQ